MFNMDVVRYAIKIDNEDGKFYIGVFTNINDKEFYFEYSNSQKRNEDWERIDREFGTPLIYNKEITKS